MSITIKIPDLESLPAVKLHHLPCNIGISGQANIDTYFSPEETETNGKTQISATFRGRPLDGQEMKTPEGMTGILVKEKRRPFSEEEDRTLDVVGKFDSFKKWHLSSKYTSESTIDKAINKWPIIAEALHSPVQIDKDIKKEETIS